MNVSFGVNHSFSRFLIVGALSTVLNYATFLGLFVTLSISYVIAGIIGYVAGMLFGYVVNRFWTFSDSNAEWHWGEVIGYGGVYAISLLLNTLVLVGCVEVLGLPPLVANICAIGASTFSNYLGLRYVVFVPPTREKERS